MRTAHAECAKRPSASPPRRRSRAHFAAMQMHGFAAENRPRIRRIPTAIQLARRRVTNRRSEPCRRCAAARSSAVDALTYIARVARQVWATHAPLAVKSRPMQQADGASLSPTDATKPTAWRRGSAHPDHLIRCYDRVLLRATIGSGRDVAYADTRKRANELEQPRIGSSRMQEGEPEGARFGSGQVRFVNNH
jgi:hypothetical protein